MTYQPPPPGATPPPTGPPPAGPPTAGKAKLRGRHPLRLSAIFLVVAIALFVVGGVTTDNSQKKVDSFQRISVATDEANVTLSTVTFSKAGGYIAYYEASDVTSDITKIPEPQVVLVSPSGKELDLTTTYGARTDNKIKLLTYDHGGHHGVAVWQFHISEVGTYKAGALYTNAPTGAQMAFGTSIAKGTGIGAGFIVGGVLFLVVAITLFIIGLVKRSRHKGQLTAANFQGGYPPVPGGYPPAGGYPPPGFQQPGFQQPPPQAGYQPPSAPGGYQPPQAPGGYQPPQAPGGYQPPPSPGYAPPEPPDNSGYQPPQQ